MLCCHNKICATVEECVMRIFNHREVGWKTGCSRVFFFFNQEPRSWAPVLTHFKVIGYLMRHSLERLIHPLKLIVKCIENQGIKNRQNLCKLKQGVKISITVVVFFSSVLVINCKWVWEVLTEFENLFICFLNVPLIRLIQNLVILCHLISFTSQRFKRPLISGLTTSTGFKIR